MICTSKTIEAREGPGERETRTERDRIAMNACSRSTTAIAVDMINSSSNNSATINGSMSPSSTANPQSQGLKAYFKTPEGRYKLHSEKTHPAGLLPYAHGKSVTQVSRSSPPRITLAQLKEKPNQAVVGPSSSYSASSGVRYVAQRFLGSSNGSRGLSFVGGGGPSKTNGGAYRSSSFAGSNGSGSNSIINSNFDGKGTYLIFNVGDTLYVSDLNSQDKDPIKAIHFNNSNPVCHAFGCESKDGHDLIIGLNCGDVYSVSLRQQLQDFGKNFNQLAIPDSRCTSVAWIPGRDGAFVVAHADGNLYGKDGTGDVAFPVIKDLTQFSVAHAKSSKLHVHDTVYYTMEMCSPTFRRLHGYHVLILEIEDLLSTKSSAASTSIIM
ncbi:unnamed protein product [Thlaspi arvense]|uniref:Uncharacterized protein n=1 Tax=Thlaspi arvense TaxID=13288 RepID=A0AAU9RKH7_THLAR|nr:unnamed protein product [Thlaspi arvense]